MRAREILETCVYAADLDAAERFYSTVLGLERIARVEGRHVFFRCGGRVFLVFNPEATAEGSHVPGHGSTGPGHACFAVTADELDGWRAHLAEAGVEIEQEHEWPGGGRSIYFRDPAGNSIELGTPSIWKLSEEETFGQPPPGLGTGG
jgi:catechol 2,3-dioxygenase-like lactoylglutathione lyase family enzyme